ncbi:MAG TPA: hypothetical protein PLY93_04220 [Turneriella sp.]|nr:hypothetical protein [Turneriella sp.]
MKHLIGACLFFIFASGAIVAGPIRDEYFKTKDDIDKSKDTPEMRKQFLEMNIQRCAVCWYVTTVIKNPIPSKFRTRITSSPKKINSHTILNLKTLLDFSPFRITPNTITLYHAKKKLYKNLTKHKTSKEAWH